ncbi:MAG: cupredoxin domain-containing protein [Bryobacterales bacterium]|nr:cupredoxin domain-containing protein [Bryobacterales bacterium]
MDGTQWLVVIAGIAAIGWVNWYFFLARRPSFKAAAAAGGVQEIVVTVHGGYSPSIIQVSKGKPVRLIFDRQEISSCSEEVVLGSFGIRKFLPAFEKTAVEFTPSQSGSFEFTCGMSMLRGKIVVE